MSTRKTFQYKGSFNNLEQIRDLHIRKECIFLGRSNAGKSSFINALLGEKVAHTSKEPGKTVSFNYFIANDNHAIVDTPGYGYAKVGGSLVKNWDKLATGYFSDFGNRIARCFIILDARRIITNHDMQMMAFLDNFNVNYEFIFTKQGKLSRTEVENFEVNVQEMVQKIRPRNLIQEDINLVDSIKGTNIFKLNKRIFSLLYSK